MLKLFKFLLLLLLIPVGIFLAGSTKADTFSWLTSALSFQKGPDVTAAPMSLNSNIDCQKQSDSTCSMPTNYGAATQQGTVRLNGASGFQSVISYIDNRQHFLPVPNSSTFMSYTTEPPYGFYLYFNYNFASSISKVMVGSGFQYQVNRPPDGRLVDKANHRLAADYASMNFSSNGQWMVVSMPNVAMLRVNLQTFEVVPFGNGFNYTIGIDPAIRTAITNDGRYAVVSSQGFNTFKIYDLSSCSAVPDTINGPVACQSRGLQPFLNQQLPGYSFSSNVKFISNSGLSTYATYLVGAARKTALVTIGASNEISSEVQLLGMGESYISGEGAFDYQAGTDTVDNKCHLSLISYPYLSGHDLNFDSYHSIACSGALTNDINDISIPTGAKKPQYPGKESPSFDDSIYSSYLPGYRAQVAFVARYRPQTILLSIGGNDIGFSKIVTRCGVPWELTTCYSSYEDRLELVREINNSLFPKLVQTYQTIKNSDTPDARIYVVGYPQIAKPGGNCAVNVHLRDAEVLFSQQLISYLDSVIQLAASKAGVYYVDAQDALNGHRLCEAKGGSVAVNGLTLGNDLPTPFGPIGNESYHPNDLGHQLLENKILATTHNLTDLMPAPHLNVVPPAENNLEILNAVHSARAVIPTQYDDSISTDLVYAGSPTSISVDGAQHALKPSTSYRIELHSTPVILGNYSTDSSGILSSQVTIPASTAPGSHTLHIYGTSIAGDLIDIYKTIFVGASPNDFDGDGIANSSDPCQFITPTGQDYDQDGIDDACDGRILDPPAATTPQPQPQAAQPENIQAASTNTIQVALLPNFGVQPYITDLNQTTSSTVVIQTSQISSSISVSQASGQSSITTTSYDQTVSHDSSSTIVSNRSTTSLESYSNKAKPKVLGAHATKSTKDNKLVYLLVPVGGLLCLFAVWKLVLIIRK